MQQAQYSQNQAEKNSMMQEYLVYIEGLLKSNAENDMALEPLEVVPSNLPIIAKITWFIY